MKKILTSALCFSFAVSLAYADDSSFRSYFRNTGLLKVFDSEDAGCRGRYPVDVSVSYSTPEYSVESVEDVSHFARGLASIGGNWLINGLTSGVLNGGISIRGSETPDCFYPKNIQINFSYEDPINIYVLSKYEEGSCNYNVILNHEMVHYDIFKRAPRDLDRHIRNSALSAIDHYFKFYLAKGMGTQDNFTHLLQSTINSLVRDINDYSQLLHSRIDTKEAYMKQASLCPYW